ncbi:MAG TPA: acetate/propionate family kinase [Acidimicrobiales bacterium]|nr:acetate/propionate family kinase [Acidimicrobiales bacterium]
MNVLVVNAGSESLKLRVLDGNDRVIRSSEISKPEIAESTTSSPGSLPHANHNRDWDISKPLAEFLSTAAGSGCDVTVVGHRVVHGGADFTSAVLLDDRSRVRLASLDDLAPLHNPPARSAIDAATRLLPSVPQVACFDTAFHAGMPETASTYALPSEWVKRWGIRRYGFHGLSCAYAIKRAAAILGRPVEELRVVVCHLGGGASVTSVSRGRSMDTTMGFTPLEGLVMATRAGDVDPGALVWVLQHGVRVEEAADALEYGSGLLALSGDRTEDMKELLSLRSSGDERAALAVGVYVHRLRAKIAAMMAATDGTDALVFTGGVGEHSAPIRSSACSGMAWLGVEIDDVANASADHDCDISGPGSSVRTLVIRAREDLEIASECRQLLGGISDGVQSAR